MALLEEAMRHFYWKAKIEVSLWLAIRRWYSVHKEFEGMKPRNGGRITCRPQDIRGVAQQVSLSSEIRGFVVIALNGSPVAIDLACMPRKHHVLGRTEN